MTISNSSSANASIFIEGIQPFGCLIRFDTGFEKVLQASQNLQEKLGMTVDMALSSTPRDILGAKLLQRFQQSLHQDSRTSTAFTINRQVNGVYQRFYVMAYYASHSVVVEFEPLSRSGERRLLPIVNKWLSRLSQVQDMGELQRLLVQSVQAVTGFHRVLLCQFDADWNRTAIAEACSDDNRSLLHYRFPATDIPAEVRERYRINPLRHVPDVKAEMVALHPAAKVSGLPVADLTLGMLRALSPYHQHYLHGIKVGASLSIAIAGEQMLWGILTCHHFTDIDISPAERDAAFNLVQMATQRLFLLQARQQALFLKNVLKAREKISIEYDKVTQPTQLVEKYGHEWMALFSCSGMALIYRDQLQRVGQTLKQSELNKMANWLTEHASHQSCWVSKNLTATALAGIVNLRNHAGLLAIPLPVEQHQTGWLLMFRQAEKQQYRWVGQKSLIKAQTSHPLHAVKERGYEIWVETIADEARSWSNEEQKAAHDFAEDLAVAITLHQINRLNSELQRANQQLKEIAHTDSLTKIWNRYRMELAIDAELASAKRYGHPCSVLLFDVDHFKSVNDTHGHEIGDQVLAGLAEQVQSKLRSSDYFGRWGGEEFIVLAAHNSLEEALCLAERLRQHIETVTFKKVGKITVSIGVAQALPEHESRRQLLERADIAMYKAKQSGRNRVEAASAELSAG